MQIILKALSIVLLCVLSAPVFAACEKSLRIVRVGTEGLDDQIAKDILERANCDIELVRFEKTVPLDRRISLLETGQIDMIIAVNKLPERELIANFSIPFQEETIRLWTLSENVTKFQNQSLTELINNGVRIIGPSSGYYGPEFEALKEAEHPQVILYKQVLHGLTLLYRGRGDVFLGSEHFQEYFRDPHKENTAILPQVVHRDGFHFMFSKKTVPMESIEIINTAIREYLTELNKTTTTD